MKAIQLDPRLERGGLFGLLFLAATTLHYFARPYIGPILNRDLNAANAARLINFFTPSAQVQVSGFSVGNGSTFVQVAQGCDGLDALLMVVAAVLAFPMPARRKAVGALLGALLIFTLNLFRVAGLWYCLRYWPTAFDTMHEMVGQTILIVVGVTFFALWTGAFSSRASVA